MHRVCENGEGGSIAPAVSVVSTMCVYIEDLGFLSGAAEEEEDGMEEV